MDISAAKTKYSELKESLLGIKKKLDVQQLEHVAGKLELESSKAGFWDNPQQAQVTMKELGRVRNLLTRVHDLEETISSLEADVNGLGESSELDQLVFSMLTDVVELLINLELETYLGGDFDGSDALFSLHAGQGGTEANDWVSMLLRMYTRYFDKQDWKYSILHEVRGTETGYSTITLEVRGENVYGYLKGEHGTHRLVRNSPFNSAGLRQTTFAGVEVMPVATDDIDIQIDSKDIVFSAVRASGAGGQNVNKVATSVRIVHTPTGIAVGSSSSRSQAKNREQAMKILKSKLMQLEEEKRAEAEAKLKGEHKVFGWGNQIRNYVLQPYRMVKDLRTNVETSDTDGVLDGDLQQFIDAELRTL